MSVKLLTDQHLEFLSLKEDCTGSSESTHVEMPHCCKSHVTAHIYTNGLENNLKFTLKMNRYPDLFGGYTVVQVIWKLRCLYVWQMNDVFSG